MRSNDGIGDDLTCPVEVGDLLVWIGIARDNPGIWVTDDTGRFSKRLLSSVDCLALTLGRAFDDTSLPVHIGCRDGYASGVYRLDLAEGTLAPIVRGVVGGPSFSSDGEWMAFGHLRDPYDTTDEIELWITEVNGDRAYRLGQRGSWTAILD